MVDAEFHHLFDGAVRVRPIRRAAPTATRNPMRRGAVRWSVARRPRSRRRRIGAGAASARPRAAVPSSAPATTRPSDQRWRRIRDPRAHPARYDAELVAQHVRSGDHVRHPTQPPAPSGGRGRWMTGPKRGQVLGEGDVGLHQPRQRAHVFIGRRPALQAQCGERLSDGVRARVGRHGHHGSAERRRRREVRQLAADARDLPRDAAQYRPLLWCQLRQRHQIRHPPSVEERACADPPSEPHQPVMAVQHARDVVGVKNFRGGGRLEPLRRRQRVRVRRRGRPSARS